MNMSESIYHVYRVSSSMTHIFIFGLTVQSSFRVNKLFINVNKTPLDRAGGIGHKFACFAVQSAQGDTGVKLGAAV